MPLPRLLSLALLVVATATRAVAAQGTAAPAGAARATLPDSLAPRIDAVFAQYARTDAPGCALGVYRNGAVAYAKGYGSANIEYGVPITPSTPFISGSLSKQFTAAAIALLIEQGRLSPEDDVRKYVPELPDYGTPITIAHLVHHTSGLRDFWSLVQTAGMRPDDGYTVDDVLAIATRQKRLNFTPGSDYNYSNTGYVVMGVVVQRVSGKSLRQFADEQIFGPLGMKNTHFHDDHTMPVAGRAAAYSPIPTGGWRINIWNNDIVGQGGVMTTIEDLARWDENFSTGRVGGPRFLARQLQRGKLTNDSTLSYAYGLTVGEYRGLPIVEHGGSTGGYRTVLTRFPSARTSVAAMCNVANANPTALARRVADVVLAASFTKPVPAPSAGGGAPGSPSAAAAVALSVGELAPLAGRYYSSELDATYELAVAGQALLLRRPRSEPDTLRAIDARTFRAGPLTLRFPPAAVGAAAPGFTVDIGRARGMEFVRTEVR